MIKRIKCHGICRWRLLIPGFFQNRKHNLRAIREAKTAQITIVVGQSILASGHRTAKLKNRQLIAVIIEKLPAADSDTASMESRQLDLIHL
jgi:hypothetical protein